MNDFNSQPSTESRILQKSLKALGTLALAASFSLAPNLAHADEQSDTATVGIEMSAGPSPSPSVEESEDISINDDAMYPSPEPTPTVYPDISINDDAMYPVQPQVTETLPRTGTPVTPVVLAGISLVGMGAAMTVAGKRS